MRIAKRRVEAVGQALMKNGGWMLENGAKLHDLVGRGNLRAASMLEDARCAITADEQWRRGEAKWKRAVAKSRKPK